MWDPYKDFDRTVLSNGLTVHASHWPGGNWQHMYFIVHTGGSGDAPDRQGTAHFVEHLVSNNAPISNREIETWFEIRGGSVMLGSTSFKKTGYAYTTPSSSTELAEACNIFGNMLLNARLEKEIEEQRRVILREWRKRFPSKFGIRKNEFITRILRANTSLAGCSIRPLGTPTSIEMITQQDLQNFYDTHYTPANMSVVTVGGMTVSEITSVISRSTLGCCHKPGARTVDPQPIAILPPLEKSVITFTLSAQKPAISLETASLSVTARVPHTVPELLIRIAKRVTNSVLFAEIREKRGYTYSINCYSERLPDHSVVEIDCSSFDPKFVEDMPRIVKTCLQIARDKRTEFDQERRSVIRAKHMLDQSGQTVCQTAATDVGEYGRVISNTEEITTLESLRFEDFQGLLDMVQGPGKNLTVIERP